MNSKMKVVQYHTAHIIFINNNLQLIKDISAIGNKIVLFVICRLLIEQFTFDWRWEVSLCYLVTVKNIALNSLLGA